MITYREVKMYAPPPPAEMGKIRPSQEKALSLKFILLYVRAFYATLLSSNAFSWYISGQFTVVLDVTVRYVESGTTVEICRCHLV